MKRKDELIKILPVRLRVIFENLPIDFKKLQEIRLRIDKPLFLIYDNKEYFVSGQGELKEKGTGCYIVSEQEIKETVEYMSNYSLYAFEEEVKQGFVTVQGGHRIGIAGKTVIEQNEVKNIKYITFINIRLAHEIKGCADFIMPYLIQDDVVCHTLIVSPPRCGKTTLLRDIVRQISNGERLKAGVTVGVVDERSEIGACYMGIPQNDLGMRTDVLDCCPKAKGMIMLVRSMSPGVIAVDEIGSREDIDAIRYIINCGCKLICTVHGSSMEEIRTKPLLGSLIREKIFKRYVVLNNLGKIGNISEIFDSQGNCIYKGGKERC
jgi:stage III sporulation protein AA